MITIEQLSKVYHSKGKSVIGVDDVTLNIDQGEIYGIVGYSGAGKSTLLRCMNVLERPTSGIVRIDGIDLMSLSPKELRKARQSIGMIFQGFHLAMSKTVLENVAFALKASGVGRKERRKRAEELLVLVGLDDKANQYPAQLSGGQKQRVSIARALANNPKVLLCDEATSALDPNTTKSILKLLQEINRELGLTIVLITHEMEVVKEICDRCAVMEEGRIVEQGSTYDIFAYPENELTKRFIQTVIDFQIPEEQLVKSQGTIVHMTITGELAGESIVSDLLQHHDIRGNILHGKIDYIQNQALGMFVMELTGDRSEVERAIGTLHDKLEEVEVLQDAGTADQSMARAE
ncbi:methionine ABC transporter ATP-binding protein [Halobacillus karajensis]|uniref:Methionine import ATP-binding protein MetN n=1 Tax=Halobacillus karajensis TaxID=195088 RepID=A0A024P1C7_9BACI|nr:methionine ABC transporter ATP-binding protein [Halobacillus karajensis]CDQ19400.1 Methionine import ATP-binding protein MetN [Halobacillus karajensis]CDQ21863.1 Methionine import ATP-binding protein MetN [Halobacillus karajensis]CDQ27703.1 Methionine import ATP-binding protein MetN [Halobacillus karajensis]